MPIIEVDHDTKEFQLVQFHGFKLTALDSLRRQAGQHAEEQPPSKALGEVSVSAESGEALGIIGHLGTSRE